MLGCLVSSSSRSRLILVLAAANSAWGVKTLIISLSKAFADPIAALPTTIFCNIIAGLLGNSG